MKKLFWLFPVLFLIDNVMGFNGYQFTFFGIGIRIILFALSVASLLLYCLFVIKEEQISIFKRKPGQAFLPDHFRPIDFFVLGFVVVNLFWATAIPLLKGGSLSLSLDDAETTLVFALYFPCAFLMRTGRLTRRGICNWFFPLLLLLALWHCVMYICEVVAPGSYMAYYDFIDKISFGTAVRTDVIEGYGITRIIQITSLFLIPAFLLTLEASIKKLPFLIAVPLVLFATIVTYTKSIWFGILAGLVVALIGIVIFSKDKKITRRCGIFALVFVLIFCLFNYGFLDNTVISRATNSAKPDKLTSIEAQMAELREQLSSITASSPSSPTGPSTPSSSEEDILKKLEDLEHLRQDAAGTAQANNLRSLQTKALMDKWSTSKLVGYGYGAYTEDCIRNEKTPYMYESLIPAMFLKLGIAGLLCWGIFVLALVVFAIKAMWKKPVRFWCWIGTALAYAMAVQTNPFLFTFAGMSLMLYLLLFIVDAQEEKQAQ